MAVHIIKVGQKGPGFFVTTQMRLVATKRR